MNLEKEFIHNIIFSQIFDAKSNEDSITIINERKYFNNSGLDSEEVEDLSLLVDKYFSAATSEEDALRNAKWQIENIRFDNL